MTRAPRPEKEHTEMLTGFPALRAAFFTAFAAIALTAVVTVGQGSVQAQTQPTPAAIAAAKELIDLKGAAHMFDPMVPGVIETAKNALLPTNPGLAKDLNEVAAELRKEFADKRGEIATLMARIYAQHFTEAEIKQALAFYKTPLGKKLITQEPQILEQSMGEIQRWGEQFQDQIMTRIRAEMRKRGHEL